MRHFVGLALVGITCFAVQAHVIAGRKGSSASTKPVPKVAGVTLQDNKGHKEQHKTLWRYQGKKKRRWCKKGEVAWGTVRDWNFMNSPNWLLLCLPAKLTGKTMKVKASASCVFERMPKFAKPKSGWITKKAKARQRLLRAGVVTRWRGKGTIKVRAGRTNAKGIPQTLHIEGTLSLVVPPGMSGIQWAGLKPNDIKRKVKLKGEVQLKN